MKPAPFTYHRPGSLQETLELMARLGPTAAPLAGGQSLGPMLNMRLARPEHLVDLNDLLELDYIRDDGAVVEIGAMTRHHRLAGAAEIRSALPLLACAAATIGHYAIRQRGTLGGSVIHADPAAQLPLVALTLDAEVVLSSARGTRRVAVRDFIQSAMTVDLDEGEILTALRFPRAAPADRAGFELFSRRHGDFALASVAVSLRCDDDGRCDMLRLGVGGVGPVPMRLSAQEAAALGQRMDDATADRLAQEGACAIAVDDTPQAPAAFRRDLLRDLIARALRGAAAPEELAA
ncbi:FAD binding domain-containing protein [Brevirhabdus sp.]|uniref:FAD binding domain-containing protein n=1 Tax=Brevirhabdus sp. TaxID=2004514 RepID=UPI004057D2D2